PSVHDQGHAGPAPSSMTRTWLLAFLLPLLVIAALVYMVAGTSVPPGTTVNSAEAVAQRIGKVGKLEFRAVNREPRTGEQVFKAQCTNCHTAGLVGAPKFGDAAAWAPRIKTGFAALLNSALKGKNAMGPQGGGEFDAYEVSRAVVYMANAGGAKFPEPPKPAAAEAAK
ncbi:MAG: c-type cytochrome, partial [Rhodoferax sp.]